MFFALLKCIFCFAYVSGSASFPKPLTSEAEYDALMRFKAGDMAAKNMLIEHNLRLVAHVVKKYSNHQKDMDDFISIGTIGLIKAITTFNVEKGARLATYAARCIDNEILMNLRASKKHSHDVYLQEPIGTDKEGNEVTMEDKMADFSYRIDEQVGLKIQIIQLYEKISAVLRGREKMIIEMRYGLGNREEITQREIAKLLGISRSYVSRIEKKALSRLQQALEGAQ